MHATPGQDELTNTIQLLSVDEKNIHMDLHYLSYVLAKVKPLQF